MDKELECKEEFETPMSEQEKTDFVSGKFLHAITDFSIFKRGEAYWLEYIGNDTYCGRSDNCLNERIGITPRELIRYFSKEPLHPFEYILSEFAYHARTWGLTCGESNTDFCNVQAHRWAREMIKDYDCKKSKLVEKACEWLGENAYSYNYIKVGLAGQGDTHDIGTMLEDFRKAMEENL